MTFEGTHVLLPIEAEAYAETLRRFNMKDIGNAEWARQHEMMEKLNMQAVLNASAQEDEFIKDFLISGDKLPVLIYDLLITEVWKEKIFTELKEMEFEPKTTFPLYMVLYHEATVLNLLETVMFYRESCEAAEDYVLDLVDYCYRKLTDLVARSEEEDDEVIDPSELITSITTSTNMEELEEQEKKLNFEICIKALSLLRYVTDHFECLPLSVLTRVLETHDCPMLLVQLVETPPWTRRKNGKIFKYIDSKWQEVGYQDSLKLTKTEGQLWLALFHLLMDPKCQQKYDMSPYRKNIILKLRSYVSEVLLDQIPVLGDMQRYLEHLSMMDPPPSKKDLVLEQIPEIRENILRENKGKWAKIAKRQSRAQFNPSQAEMKEQAKRLADTYSFDVLEGLLPDAPKCAACGEAASKRCSRCQNEWYCRRECQVQNWPKHKKACDLLYDSLQKIKEETSNTSS